MTFDELVQAFDKAYCEKLDDAEGTRAGVRAVVLALRDEMIAIWNAHGDPVELLDEILGDAGAGKVAGGATRKDVLDGGAARTVTQVPGSPATDTAPGPAFYLEEAAPIPQSAIDKLTASAIGKDFRFTHTSLGPVPQNTDPAPAVCVWRMTPSGWYEGACDKDCMWSDTHEWCPSCGKPIKFVETSPAPAVCEFRGRPGRYIRSCNGARSIYNKPFPPEACAFCKKPVKFTEAK